MAQLNPTLFIDDAAVAVRAPEVPAASFDNGMNLGGCAPGIGINFGAGAVVGTPEQFTLLDQFGNARVAQISQHIGGSGLGAGTEGTLPDAVIRSAPNDASGDGSVGAMLNANLNTLTAGWVGV